MPLIILKNNIRKFHETNNEQKQRNELYKNRCNILVEIRLHYIRKGHKYECPVCFENNAQVGHYRCCHEICEMCLTNVRICPLCRCAI